MYKVIRYFTDLRDKDYKYNVGDEYPRLGLKPSLARIEELKSSHNKQKTPLIEEVDDLPGYIPETEDVVEDTTNFEELSEDKPAEVKRARKKQEK